MEIMEKELYLNTVYYKAYVILCAYMRVMHMSGGGFAEQIRRQRAESDEDFGYTFDRNFMLFTEVGHVQLKEEEVKVFSEYIAHAMGYDNKEFWDAITFEAKNMYLNNRDPVDDGRTLIDAITAVTVHMNNYHG